MFPTGWRRQPPPGVGVNWASWQAQGLVGLWPLNEGAGLEEQGGRTAYDVTGISGNATEQWPNNGSGGGIPQDGAGENVHGQGLWYNYDFDMLQTTHGPRLDVEESDEAGHPLDFTGSSPSFTWDFWARPRDYGTFIAKRKYGAQQYQFLVNSNGNGSNWGGGIEYVTATTYYNTWQHYTWVRDGSACRLYIDGRFIASGTHTVSVSHEVVVVTFGARRSSGSESGYPLNGAMGCIRCYNRSLSAAEIWALHADPWHVFQPIRRYWMLNSAEVTGTFAGSTPLVTMSASGTAKHTGTFAGSTPLVTMSASGTAKHTGTFAGSTPLATMAAAGEILIEGTFAGSTPIATMNAAGYVMPSGQFAGTIPISIMGGIGKINGFRDPSSLSVEDADTWDACSKDADTWTIEATDADTWTLEATD